MAKTTRDATTKYPPAKAAAIALLTKGLVTPSEASRLAGVTRQLVRHWAKSIPVDQARDTYLTKIWAKEIDKRS